MVEEQHQPKKDGIFWTGRIVAISLILIPSFVRLSFWITAVAALTGVALYVWTSWRARV